MGDVREVMQKAQELAEAITRSDVCRRTKKLENELEKDPAASAAVADMLEKRGRMQQILSEADMDPDKLKTAAEAVELAEKKMNEIPAVAELKDARQDFDLMMENVNRILRLVITGETQEDDTNGCTGNCATCGGCH